MYTLESRQSPNYGDKRISLKGKVYAQAFPTQWHKLLVDEAWYNSSPYRSAFIEKANNETHHFSNIPPYEKFDLFSRQPNRRQKKPWETGIREGELLFEALRSVGAHSMALSIMIVDEWSAIFTNMWPPTYPGMRARNLMSVSRKPVTIWSLQAVSPFRFTVTASIHRDPYRRHHSTVCIQWIYAGAGIQQ